MRCNLFARGSVRKPETPFHLNGAFQVCSQFAEVSMGGGAKVETGAVGSLERGGLFCLGLRGHRAGKGPAQAGGQLSAGRPGVRNTQLMEFPIHLASYSSWFVSQSNQAVIIAQTSKSATEWCYRWDVSLGAAVCARCSVAVLLRQQREDGKQHEHYFEGFSCEHQFWQ